MGERNLVLRYQMSRAYAEKQAAKLESGESLQGWTHVHDWTQSEPEPPTITLIGAAWVAHCYDIVREDAELLASRDTLWNQAVEDCRLRAERYRKQSEA